MALDLKNIDWSALAASKVMIGNAIAIISLGAAITGHELPDSAKSQLTDLITQLFMFVATAGALYSSFHRATAQAENATTIIPKKPSPPTA